MCSQRVFADTCRFFFDPYGGHLIGGVWDPNLKEEREFKALGGYSTLPAEVQLSQKEVVDKTDICVLG